MLTRYKIIVAPTIYRLEELVNAFLAQPRPATEDLYFKGAPQCMGHEEYIQTIHIYDYSEATNYGN